MSMNADILNDVVIRHGNRCITIWPVLEVSSDIAPEHAAIIQRQWPRFENAMRTWHRFQQRATVTTPMPDAVADACRIIESFEAMCIEMFSGTYRKSRRSRGRKSGMARSNFRHYETIKSANIRVE